VQTALLNLPGGAVGRPFTKGSTAGAGLQNTFTLPARTNARYALRSLIVTSNQIAVVNGPLTISNIGDDNGAPQTITFQLVESANEGGRIQIDFGPDGMWSAADNLAVVVNLAAIGSGAITAIVLNGLVVS
jgi:hypothetical protein